MITQQVVWNPDGNRNNLVLARKAYNQGSNNVKALPVALKLWLFFLVGRPCTLVVGGVCVGLPVRTKTGPPIEGTCCSPSPLFFRGWRRSQVRKISVLVGTVPCANERQLLS